MSIVDYPALRQSDLGGWGADNGKDTFHYESVHIEAPDYFSRMLHPVKSFTVEFIGGSDRGAMIKIWEELYSPSYNVKDNLNLSNVIDLYSDPDEQGGSTHRVFDQVNFMHYANAAEEFKVITSFGDILELCRRNA